MGKTVIIGIVVLALAAAAVWWVQSRKPEPPVPSQEQKGEGTLGEELFERVEGPKLPKTNPFETETNPLEAAQTNPFEGVKTNPFE